MVRMRITGLDLSPGAFIWVQILPELIHFINFKAQFKALACKARAAHVPERGVRRGQQREDAGRVCVVGATQDEHVQQLQEGVATLAAQVAGAFQAALAASAAQGGDDPPAHPSRSHSVSAALTHTPYRSASVPVA